jgi:hypothetical protein
MRRQQREIYLIAKQDRECTKKLAIAAIHESQHQDTKSYGTRSLCGLSTTNPIRQFLLSLTMNQWFERLVIVVIMMNCVMLSVEDPLAEQTQVQISFEMFFIIFYTAELLVKVCALGFVMEQFSYLRDPWNMVSVVRCKFYSCVCYSRSTFLWW